MISFFFDRTRRKVRSFCGSMSRTQLRACAARLCSRPAYCTVVELSSVVRTGIPTVHNHLECNSVSSRCYTTHTFNGPFSGTTQSTEGTMLLYKYYTIQYGSARVTTWTEMRAGTDWATSATCCYWRQKPSVSPDEETSTLKVSVLAVILLYLLYSNFNAGWF